MSSIESTTVSDVSNTSLPTIKMSSLSSYLNNNLSARWAEEEEEPGIWEPTPIKENPLSSPKFVKPAWKGSLPTTIVGKRLTPKTNTRSLTPKSQAQSVIPTSSKKVMKHSSEYHPFQRLLRPQVAKPPPPSISDDVLSETIVSDKYLSPSVRIADTDGDLVLYHYINCDDSSDDLVKSSRGIVRSGDTIICKTFGYTPEIVSTNVDKIKSLLPSIEKYNVYDAEEGATLRVYCHNNRWYLSTHRKIDAYHSRWGSSLSQSFGDMFIDALEWEVINGTLKGIVEYENRNDVFDRYCETLDKNKNYTFLVRNSKDNRIVCDAQSHSQVYFIGAFDKSIHLLVEGNDSNIKTPNSYTFTSVDDLLDHVNNIVNYTLKQGVIVYLNNQTQIKIMNPSYVNYFNARGNEPSIKFRYLQVRMDKDKVAMLYNLYPEFIPVFEKYENVLIELARKIHRAYVNRFINHQYVSLPQPEYFVMQTCHSWHIQNRIHNKISHDKVLDIIDNQTPTSLNRMIKPYLSSKNQTVDVNSS